MLKALSGIHELNAVELVVFYDDTFPSILETLLCHSVYSPNLENKVSLYFQ